MKRLMMVFALGVALLAVPVVPTAAADDAEEVSGEFAGQGALFTGVFDDDEFDGVLDFGPPQTAVWTFDEGDELRNLTTSFVIAGPAGPGDGMFPLLYTQTIEFTGGTGDFAGASGSAAIVGTIDFDTLEYDGRIEGVLIEGDDDDDDDGDDDDDD